MPSGSAMSPGSDSPGSASMRPRSSACSSTVKNVLGSGAGDHQGHKFARDSGPSSESESSPFSHEPKQMPGLIVQIFPAAAKIQFMIAPSRLHVAHSNSPQRKDVYYHDESYG